MTKLINLYGSPGSGKTTLAYKLSAALKERGFTAVAPPEYATDIVYDRMGVIDVCQNDILMEQFKRVFRYYPVADFIISDSPLLMQLAYAGGDKDLEKRIKALAGVFPEQEHYLVRRDPSKKHTMQGRIHDSQEAAQLDEAIAYMVRPHVNTFLNMSSDDIFHSVMRDLRSN